MEPPDLLVDVIMDGLVELVLGTFMFNDVIGGVIGVGGGEFVDMLVNSVGEAGGGAVAVDEHGFTVRADEDLQSGVNGVLGIPVNMETGNQREKARAGEGEVTPRGREGSVWSLAGWQIAMAIPPVSDGPDVRPPISDEFLQGGQVLFTSIEITTKETQGKGGSARNSFLPASMRLLVRAAAVVSRSSLVHP